MFQQLFGSLALAQAAATPVVVHLSVAGSGWCGMVGQVPYLALTWDDMGCIWHGYMAFMWSFGRDMAFHVAFRWHLDGVMNGLRSNNVGACIAFQQP